MSWPRSVRTGIVASGLLGLAATPLAWGQASPSHPQESPEDDKPLEVEIDRDSVDLERHRLSLKMSRPPDFVRIKVIGQSGATLAQEEHNFRGKPAGAPLSVTWKPASAEPVARIEVFAYDVRGYFKGIAITPWSLTIPHEEVHFETNSAKILASEEHKLEASLGLILEAWQKHKDLGPVRLFVIGHTDTVGTPAHNQQLSEKRARSIAAWFRAHGFAFSLAYAGAGELAPKVKTQDEVDEPQNRRADYLLALEPPRLKAGDQMIVFREL